MAQKQLFKTTMINDRPGHRKHVLRFMALALVGLAMLLLFGWLTDQGELIGSWIEKFLFFAAGGLSGAGYKAGRSPGVMASDSKPVAHLLPRAYHRPMSHRHRRWVFGGLAPPRSREEVSRMVQDVEELVLSTGADVRVSAPADDPNYAYELYAMLSRSSACTSVLDYSSPDGVAVVAGPKRSKQAVFAGQLASLLSGNAHYGA